MKYARVLNGTILEIRIFSDQPPTLAENKGVWLPVEEDPYPELLENETAEPLTTITTDAVIYSWVVRTKTALELWQYPEFSLKIVAPATLYQTNEGKDILLWFQLNKLAFERKGDDVHLYCNKIESQHIGYVNQLLAGNLIEVWEKTQENVVQIYSIIGG